MCTQLPHCNQPCATNPLQNVRRQAGEIWESMRAWVDQGIMQHVLMATAIYDLGEAARGGRRQQGRRDGRQQVAGRQRGGG